VNRLKIGPFANKRAQERPLHQVERALRARFSTTVVGQNRAIHFFHSFRVGAKRRGGVLADTLPLPALENYIDCG